MRAVLVLVILVASWLGACPPVALAAAPSVYLEDLTWTEVRDAVASGTTKLICPGAAYSRDALRRAPVESVTTRLAPPSETGSGIVMACAVAVARF